LLADGGKGVAGIVTGLAEIKKELESAARFDPVMEQHLSVVSDALYQLEEVATELRDYSDNVEFNPQRLAALQDRMDVIHKLKKKYGATVEEVLAYYQQASAELAQITNYEERILELEAQKTGLEKQMTASAAELSKLRQAAAEAMAGHICGHLGNLGMPKAKLLIAVKTSERYTAAGADEVAILFSANPGEDPKPLQKVASGGELSRVALAIKTVSASRDAVGTMVFDEIDAGIGGQTAQMVAEKIALVSRDKQVLCITHLTQIAAMADRHIYVEKRVAGERTNTVVTILDDNSHLEEVARMISGDNLTRAVLENAAEMIATAQSKKRKMEK
jgi:DNA repair protein RecN (Recombination protein N)